MVSMKDEDTQELLRKVRRIEIKTRRLSNNIFAGEYHSAFKGRGMSFAEVREYQPGDDIRDIDWNVTARFNRPYIKVFEEERELTVMLLIDVSSSLNFGSKVRFEKQLVAEMAATIAFSAIQNNDKIGVIFFSDRIEQFIPPQKGRKHILNIIHQLLTFSPKSGRTNISASVEYLARAIRKRCIAFIISDFIDEKDFSKAMTVVGRKHDVVALRIYDQRLSELPNVGLMKVFDAETGHEQYVDTSSKKVRKAHHDWWLKKQLALDGILAKSNIDFVKVRPDEDYVKSLMALFSRRS